MLVLVVDPDESTGRRIADGLRRMGHRCALARDAAGARRAQRKEPAPVAIVASGLPVAETARVCARLRAGNARTVFLAGGLDDGAGAAEVSALASSTDLVFRPSPDPATLDLQLRGLLTHAEAAAGAAAREHPERLPHLDDAMTELAAEIVERRDAEDALRHQKHLLQILVENVPAAVAMFDTEMRYVAVSRQWKDNCGHGSRDVIGLSHYVTEAWVTERWRQAHRRSLGGRIERCDEEFVEFPDGRKAWMRWEVRPWFTSEKRIGGVIIFTENITERKVAAEALKEREMLYRALFDSVPVGLGVADMNGNLIAFNDFMLIPGGYTRRDIERIRNVALLYYDPQDRARALETARSQGYLDRFEVRFKRKNGGYYWALMSLKQIVIGGQRCWLSMCEDITERKKAEAFVQALTQRVLYVQEAERRRVARELHDGVNQLLTAAKFRLERLGAARRSEAAPGEVREVRDLLDEAIQEIRRIAQNLRPAVLDDLGLIAAVRSTCEEMRRRTGVDVSFQSVRLPKKLPGELEMALFRITQEALANAEKHAAARHVSVQIRRERAGFVLSVKDDGRGFVPRAVRVMRKGRKPGLGLDHMTERARLAGGRLEIRSSLGGGTEVVARLPHAMRNTRRAAAS
ncbi:MAG: PAS domain S-box protein [Planctomycetota bacterium]|nr:PAS domain S-box protein [Planctomycetota bacterium]